MSGLTDNTQLRAAGSKRDLSPESHSKLIQASTYKIRAKACKKNHSKGPSGVVGIKVLSTSCRRDKEGEDLFHIPGESISRLNAYSFRRWGRAKREELGCVVPGPQHGVAAGIRLPAEVNYAVAPRVQALVCGFVWRNIHGLTICELQGLGVFHFSVLKVKTQDNVLVASNGTSGINIQVVFRQKRA